MNMLICPLCLAIYMLSHEEGETCTDCEEGTLVRYEDFMLALSVSFMFTQLTDEALHGE
jgi:hypothetical protein